MNRLFTTCRLKDNLQQIEPINSGRNWSLKIVAITSTQVALTTNQCHDETTKYVHQLVVPLVWAVLVSVGVACLGTGPLDHHIKHAKYPCMARQVRSS